MLYPKIHQLQCIWIAVGEFFRKRIWQLVDYLNKYFAVGGFSELALRSWWIFRESTLQFADFCLEGLNFCLKASTVGVDEALTSRS